jgi:hypothetical protein
LEDTSELEGGETGDRVLRHTMSVRVEAWKWPNVEVDLVSSDIKVQANLQASLLSEKRLQCPYINEVLIQSRSGRWYAVQSIAKGKMRILPVNQPPSDNIVMYNEKSIILEDGMILKDKDSDYSFLVDPYSNPNRLKYFPEYNPIQPSIIIHNTQDLILSYPKVGKACIIKVNEPYSSPSIISAVDIKNS